MKKLLLTGSLLLMLGLVSGQTNSSWATNLGFDLGTDGYTGLMGMSVTNKAGNPFLNSDLKNKYSFSGSLSLEFLHLHQRSDATWGRTAPDIGIKTKAEWLFSFADNSNNGGGENIGLNFINVPVLMEICLGYKKGVTRATTTSGKDTYNSHVDAFGNVITEHQYEPGSYNPGGQPVASASFFYAGPQLCYLAKAFHNNQPFTSPLLKTTSIAMVGGFIFWLHSFSLDFSYQKGLTSICSTSNITVDGFSAKLGIWLASHKKRRY